MFTEDLNAFLDTAGHAVDATYNGATAVKVIFDEAALSLDGISGTNPVAVGKASDFPAASAIGKTLLIGARSFVIRQVDPLDDGSFTQLQLEG